MKSHLSFAGFRPEFWAYLSLGLWTLCAYWPVLHNDFADVDDFVYVTENQPLQAEFGWRSVAWAFTSFDAYNWHPLTWLSLMLDYQLYGLNPAGYHATNLFLHMANVFLVFAVLRSMTGSLGQSGFVAGLFAVHPLHVESVAWITERKDVLSAFFWWLTLAAYLRYARRPRVLPYCLVLVPFALGLMAKPMLVTLPCVLLLLDYWPLDRIEFRPGHWLRRSSSDDVRDDSLPRSSLPRLLTEKLPFVALSAASCVITLHAQRLAMEAQPVPWHFRVLNALLSYVRYLANTFWPTNLSIFYRHHVEAVPIGPALGAGLVLLLVTVWVVLNARRRYLLVGWFWYLGTLVPVIGLVQVGGQAMADRYTYIPLIGLQISLTWWIADEAARWPRLQSFLPFAAVTCLGGAAFLSCRQAEFWINGPTLWQRELELDTDNYQAHYYVAIYHHKNGHWEEALAHYRAALRVAPQFVLAHYNLGMLFSRRGQTEDAIEQFTEALKINPDGASAHYDLANLLENKGQWEDAEFHYREAIRVDPKHAMAHYKLGLCLLKRDEFDLASAEFTASLNLQPDEAAVLHSMGNVYEMKGQMTVAARYYQKAVALQETVSAFRLSWGEALLEEGNRAAAAEELAIALRLDPSWPDTANRIARNLVTREHYHRYDGLMACQLAKRACSATRRQEPAYLDTLAAAFADQGMFDKAVQIAREAIDKATELQKSGLLAEIQGHLELYEQRRPLRDSSPSR